MDADAFNAEDYISGIFYESTVTWTLLINNVEIDNGSDVVPSTGLWDDEYQVTIAGVGPKGAACLAWDYTNNEYWVVYADISGVIFGGPALGNANDFYGVYGDVVSFKTLG